LFYVNLSILEILREKPALPTNTKSPKSEDNLVLPKFQNISKILGKNSNLQICFIPLARPAEVTCIVVDVTYIVVDVTCTVVDVSLYENDLAQKPCTNVHDSPLCNPRT
jgi:hypothetical protein